MTDATPRIAAGLLGLALLWVGLYWWWPTAAEPRTVKAAGQTALVDRPEQHPSPVPASPADSTPLPNESPDRAASSDPSPDSAVRQPYIHEPAAKNRPDSEPKITSVPAPRPPAVIPPEFLEHTLAPGETYATLSLKYYGTAAYATSIAKANPLVSPASLKPGRTLRVPKDPKNVQGLPVREPGASPKGPTSTYTVVQGDSLSTISQRLYGESKYAKLIYEANRATMKNEHSLRVGQKLVIPPKPAP